MKKMNRTTLFLLLTYGICWSAAGIFSQAGGTYKGIGGTLLATGYMLVPAIVAIIVTGFVHREKIGKKLLISFKINRWFLVAWLTPLLLSFASLGIALLFPNVSYSPNMEGMPSRPTDKFRHSPVFFLKAAEPEIFLLREKKNRWKNLIKQLKSIHWQNQYLFIAHSLHCIIPGLPGYLPPEPSGYFP